MRDRLTLKGLPTYPENTIVKLSRINLVFGKNGSGKSTLCNFIKNNPDSLIDGKQELIVYDKQFRSSQIINGMKGIYSFGKSDPETIATINSKKELMNKIITEKNSEVEKLRGSEKQKASMFDEFSNEVWGHKATIIEKYAGADIFKGYNGDRTKFAKEFLNKYEEYSKREYDSEKIKSYYSLIKTDNTKEIPPHQLLNDVDITKIDGFDMLSKPIISHSDNDLNKYYSKLSNINWAKQGNTLMSISGGLCPFCKSKLNDEFIKELKSVFDKVYAEDIERVSSFIRAYRSHLDNISTHIESILSDKHDEFEYASIEECARKVQKIIFKEKTLLDEKETYPTSTITIENISDSINILNEHITAINEQIAKHNDGIAQRKQLPSLLTDIFWIILSKEHYKRCDSHSKSITGLDKQILKHYESVQEIDTQIEALQTDIEDLNKQISNIDNTIKDINNLLSNFGFKNFKLVLNTDTPGTYRIQRDTGVGDINTLSEGEFSLVSFLYLYRLINGSLNPDSVNDAVIVIDDPVSSMDGDTMSIVSTLTKKIISDCINETSRVKQVLIFTHNVYYYKEIEYRSDKKKKMVSYHLVSKCDCTSSIKTTEGVTIHSNYEQLWLDYKNNNSPSSTFNCMRRIIEYYFKSLIGAEGYDACRSKFNESDQILFDHLTNMLNSGSHSIFDPIDTYVDKATIEKYKEIFKTTFQSSGNIGHYNSMMKLIED